MRKLVFLFLIVTSVYSQFKVPYIQVTDSLIVAGKNVTTFFYHLDSFNMVTTDNIADMSVTTAKIANEAVTDEKLEHGGYVAVNSYWGNPVDNIVVPDRVGEVLYYGVGYPSPTIYTMWVANSTTAGDWTQLYTNCDNSSISLTNSKQLQVADAGIGSAKLADNAVVENKIAVSAVTDVKLEHGGYKAEAGGFVNVPGDYPIIPDRVGQLLQWSSSNSVNTMYVATGLTRYDWLLLGTRVDSTTISIGTSNEIAIADGGVGTAQLADVAVTEGKLATSTKEYIHKVLTVVYNDTVTLSREECFGYVVYITDTALVSLPAIEEGMNFTIRVMGTADVSIKPNSSDLIYLDGNALDDGDKITSNGTTGECAVITYFSSDGWDAYTTVWIDGGS